MLPIRLEWNTGRYLWRWQAVKGVLHFRTYKAPRPLSVDLWDFRQDFLRAAPTAEGFGAVMDQYRVNPVLWRLQMEEPPLSSGVAPTDMLASLMVFRKQLNDLLRWNRKRAGVEPGPFRLKLGTWEVQLEAHLEWMQGLPVLRTEPNSLFEALAWTAVIDHVRKARFGRCRRQDCHAAFEITSRHKRKFCSYACAHLVVVRASRKGIKKSKSETEGGGTQNGLQAGRDLVV